MNKQPKQMIVDSGDLSREFLDCALLNGIVIVSPSHSSRADRKGQIERILQAQSSAFQRLRRHDK
jgi:hypothetical protein